MRIARWVLIGVGVAAAAGLVYRLITGRMGSQRETAVLGGVTTKAA